MTVPPAVVKKTVTVYLVSWCPGLLAVPDACQPSLMALQEEMATFLRAATLLGTALGTAVALTMPSGRPWAAVEGTGWVPFLPESVQPASVAVAAASRASTVAGRFAWIRNGF